MSFIFDKPFRPVTGGADHEEEQDVDDESVTDGYDGAFRDCNTRILQLPCRDEWSKSCCHEVHVYVRETNFCMFIQYCAKVLNHHRFLILL